MTDAVEPGLFAAPPLAELERMVEAILFASAAPVTLTELTARLPHGSDPADALVSLQRRYQARGVMLGRVGEAWAFRTAPDLGHLMAREVTETRKLSRAAIETLAIIAYHQPVTRAEIEEVRGVSISKGTLDVLMETGWVRPRGRRRAPGKPITYGTTEEFLKHFSLDGVKDLPGLAELKGSGLLDANLPPDFKVPEPADVAALMPDELPLDAGGDDDMQAELELDEPRLDDGLDDEDDDSDGLPAPQTSDERPGSKD